MHSQQIKTRDARANWRPASGAYRARQRQLAAIAMAYEARPLNADHEAERDARDRRIAALPVATAPIGFDRADDSRWTDHLTWSRRMVAQCMRDTATTLARRERERAECAAIGIQPPTWGTPDSVLRRDMTNLVAGHKRLARGATPYPLTLLAAAEADIATDRLMRAGFRAAYQADLMQVAA